MKRIYVLILFLMQIFCGRSGKEITLLNVSYDPTREFFKEYNEEFAKVWKTKTGADIKINQSHGGSGKQARSVIDGLEADVVTLALSYDINEIASKGLIDAGWESAFPHRSTPFTSTIVFVVRKGNPKNIKDWDDLVKPGIGVITPNPKTSGGARWNYLAAWAYASKKIGNDENKVKDFIKKLYNNVPVLDAGARGSTTSFAQRKLGDVLISWENEAFLIMDGPGNDQFEKVIPSESILAEPPVAVVEKSAAKRNTAEAAKFYLEQLYSLNAQEIAAKHGYRPRNEEIMKKYSDKFPKLSLTDISFFGGWNKAQKDHFADGGNFDQIYTKSAKDKQENK
ncbi:MAG TPA: sulfate ABC transporter substrate-binding protein [Leptospiraceae bacterium]|nr:sulfate ABC transporter substrate-binding protein [Leptospiraceae bacterium]HNO23208.1 sulfate ABC transporter substrate-binding protein [Leptospiraceae bacterium]